MKVKAYNLSSLVRRDTRDFESPLRVWGTRHEMVVLEGPKGYVVTCSEGVHFALKRKSDTIELQCEPVPKTAADERSFRLLPTHTCNMSVEKMLGAPSREVELGQFVRSFGARLESNYQLLLGSIEKVGLDPDDYTRD